MKRCHLIQYSDVCNRQLSASRDTMSCCVRRQSMSSHNVVLNWTTSSWNSSVYGKAKVIRVITSNGHPLSRYSRCCYNGYNISILIVIVVVVAIIVIIIITVIVVVTFINAKLTGCAS